MTIYWSYRTVVAIFNGTLYLTNRKYSNTTSKHLNEIKKDYCGEIEYVSPEWLMKMVGTREYEKKRIGRKELYVATF